MRKDVRQLIGELLELQNPEEGSAWVKKEVHRQRKNNPEWKVLKFKHAKTLFLTSIGAIATKLGPEQHIHITRVLSNAVRDIVGDHVEEEPKSSIIKPQSIIIKPGE
jgi:hypothetical protein